MVQCTGSFGFQTRGPPVPCRTGLLSELNKPIVLKCCPFVGSRDDKDLVHNYPSGSNVCYAEEVSTRRLLVLTEKRSYQGISQKTQKDTCLSDAWESCPVYARRMKADSNRPNTKGKT